MLQSKEEEYPSAAPAYYCILPHTADSTDNSAVKAAGVPFSTCILLHVTAYCSFLRKLLQSKEEEYPSAAPAYYCILPHTADSTDNSAVKAAGVPFSTCILLHVTVYCSFLRKLIQSKEKESPSPVPSTCLLLNTAAFY